MRSFLYGVFASHGTNTVSLAPTNPSREDESVCVSVKRRRKIFLRIADRSLHAFHFISYRDRMQSVLVNRRDSSQTGHS
jgi:hypothetical protein